MTTDFFSKIGQELCSIKNSPFYLRGKAPKENSSSLNRSQLSFDPNRLFNVEKYNENKLNIEDQEMIRAQREEEDEARRIEFQILKNTTLEDYEKRVEDLRRELERGNTSLAPTIFKIKRTACLGCNRCAIFKGNFKGPLPSPFGQPSKTTNFLCCFNCQCPMSAHIPSKSTPLHRPYIWKYLKGLQIKEEHLNFNSLILAFRLRADKIEEELLWNLLQILQRMSFTVLQSQMMDRSTFEFKMLRCYLLGSGEEPASLEGMLQLAQCIHNSGGWRQDIQVGEQFKDHFSILKKVTASIRHRSLENVKEEDKLAVLMIKHDENSPGPSQLRQALKEITEYLSYATITHVSSSKRQALFEVQQIFPNAFQLHKRLFLLPKTNRPDENSWKFQDMLDYNGYSSFIEGIKDIKRLTLQNILNFMSYHEMTYLLGKDIANDNISKFGLYYSVKSGPQVLNYQGQLPSFLEVTEQQACNKVIQALLPSYLLGQRCVIILRPITTSISEIVVNILRINGFVVIHRTKQRLSEGEAHFISALEHISKEELPQYLEMMTSGSSQILLVSKRGALFEAQALLNSNPKGLASINTRWINEQPTFQMVRGREVFKQELNIPSSSSQEIFKSSGDLVSLERCLLGARGKKNVLQNGRTGELICVESGKIQGQFKGTSRQREEILRGLREDTFNYLLFSSKSDNSTEELASLFFPESTLFDSAIVIVKPDYLHLMDNIKQTLAQYRYHFIFHKSVNFSKLLAYQMLSPLQKLKIGSESFEEVVESFTGKKIPLLCISKIGAKREILALLSSFTFLPSRTAIDLTSGESLLRESLIPVWTNQESYLRLFNRHLSSLEEAVQLVTKEGEGALKPQQKMELYEYFVGSLLGVKPTDQNLNTSLGRMTLYSTTERISMYQSWYYATMSQIASAHVPLIFHYRKYQTETLVLQTYPGEPFMAVIVNQYIKEMELHQKLAEKYPEKSGKKRRSLVLLLWAKKIFQVVERMSGLDEGRLPSIEVDGWGSLIFRNGQHCGEFTGIEAQGSERIFLEKLLTKYQTNRPISTNIKRLLASRLLVERYQAQERRLLPTIGELPFEQTLRVIETGDVSHLFLKDEFQMLDPDNQKQILNHQQMFALKLFRVDPIIAPKYHFFAQIFMFLQKWKEEALQYREVFGEIEEHIKGMVSKYPDLEALEFQIYIQTMRKLSRGDIEEEDVKPYPNLRKNKMRAVLDDDQVGKNRKFLSQKHYFKPSYTQSHNEIQEINQKYGKFNLKTLEEPLQHHVLNQADDLLHKQWNTQQNFVNLLRNTDSSKKVRDEHHGIFVQYQKHLNQNEERLKQQVQIQVDRLQERGEGNIVKDNGLDPDLWYKRVKGNNTIKTSSKVQDAIMKQLEKLTKFKSSVDGFATK